MNTYEVGTPQNPEVIEPGQTRARGTGRLQAAFQILKWMIVIALPAFCLGTISVWLLEDGSLLAWLLLVLFGPPTLLAIVVTTIVELFLALMFFATLLGKAVAVKSAPFARFAGSRLDRFSR